MVEGQLEGIGQRLPMGFGLRREVFALDEGDVEITYPERLSAESFSDLRDYLEVFIKRMKRLSLAV
jgi:hypothetical protein